MKSLFNDITDNFTSKTLQLENGKKKYFLTVKNELVGDRLRLNHTLESAEGKVASVSLYYAFNDEDGIKKWNFFGYTEVPESMFEIDHLYVEPKFRNAGIGTAFFNLIMQSITDFDKAQNLHSKIVLVRMNTPEAIAFFDKWSATENDKFLDEQPRTTRMLINKPCVVPAKNFEQTNTAKQLQ